MYQIIMNNKEAARSNGLEYTSNIFLALSRELPDQNVCSKNILIVPPIQDNSLSHPSWDPVIVLISSTGWSER